MNAGQNGGSGSSTELHDEEVQKNDILSNREKAQRRPGQSLDSQGVRVDQYKDTPANHRPEKDEQIDAVERDAAVPTGRTDRPGFDLGGATGEDTAGKGLGLGTDAQPGRSGWKLPR